MWRRVDIVLTDVLEERIASIFRVEEKRRKSASEEPATSQKAVFFITAVKTSNLRTLQDLSISIGIFSCTKRGNGELVV
jgi:hypothetical protein